MDPAMREKVKKELVDAIGAGKVLHSASDLEAYRSDSFYRFMPDGSRDRYSFDLAVLPESTEDVQKIVRIASEHGVPIVPKGGGSNLTGMLIPLKGGILLDTIRMNRIIEVSAPDLRVTVQPGITLKEVDEALRTKDLALNQLQGSYKVATVGGSISTAGFPRKHNKYGTIADRIMSMEVVLADGRVLRTGPKVLYTSTGYRLHQLFVGAEGTLGVITEVTLRVEPLPEAHAAVMAYYDDFRTALDVAMSIKMSCVTTVGLEAFEIPLAWGYEAPPGKLGLVIADFEGTKGEVEAGKEFVAGIIRKTGGAFAKPGDAESYAENYDMIWCGLKALTDKKRDYLTSFIPVDKIAEFYDKVWNDILPRHRMTRTTYSERYSLDIGRYEMTYATFSLPEGDGWHAEQLAAGKEIAELATSLGGSVAACMGVGLKYRDYMGFEYSSEALETMRAIKKLLDPKGIMNPLKMLPEEKPR